MINSKLFVTGEQLETELAEKTRKGPSPFSPIADSAVAIFNVGDIPRTFREDTQSENGPSVIGNINQSPTTIAAVSTQVELKHVEVREKIETVLHTLGNLKPEPFDVKKELGVSSSDLSLPLTPSVTIEYGMRMATVAKLLDHKVVQENIELKTLVTAIYYELKALSEVALRLEQERAGDQSEERMKCSVAQDAEKKRAENAAQSLAA